MNTTYKSLILNLTETNWLQELQVADITPLAKEKLTGALKVKLNRKGKMPRMTSEEFDEIIRRDVFFLTIGERRFLLVFKKGEFFLTEQR